MEQNARYQRNQSSISPEEQAMLMASTVAVIGCGGLGGYMAEELARLGIGHLILIDGDRFDETNLNRQLFATEDNIGEWKVEAARRRLQGVNSKTDVQCIQDWFHELGGETMLGRADLVLDALDSLSARLELERVCNRKGIPLVFAGVAGWFGLLGVSRPGEFLISKLFGKNQSVEESTLGNLAFTPAVVASLAVAEGVKILTGKQGVLNKSWLQINLLAMEFETIKILD
ncbi:MAG TPA: HesA/MoeB/ThiF family protein [Desulfosporosinus sp.]|nr:HesA/MoeB/ThiF family protein [Desulfosporosinus sp.]